jgi:threonine dehydratase
MIGINEIEEARDVVSKYLVRTPMIAATAFSESMNRKLFFKHEGLQKTGSFKPRGSLNRIYHLSPEEVKRGVITVSSGNHAQGLAFAARVFGVKATVVMRKETSKMKVAATRRHGAEVVLTEGDPFQVAAELRRERSLCFVHPFDDRYIIAGHGSLGLEIVRQCPDLDFLFVPVGGGGLFSGVASAIKQKRPSVKIVGVEPVGASAMWQSLQKGKVVVLERAKSVAAGLSPPFVGELNFQIVRECVDDLVLVTDNQITESLWLTLEQSKLLSEASGAASFAGFQACLSKIPDGAVVVCLISGANIDRHELRDLWDSQSNGNSDGDKRDDEDFS